MSTETETKLVVSPDEAEALRKIIARDKLKVRAGGQGLINKATLTFRTVPVIQMWNKAKRRYMILSFKDGWHFESNEDRDATLKAIAP